MLSTSHPFPHFPQCLPVLFLLCLVFSFSASSFWSSSPKSGISLRWNTENVHLPIHHSDSICWVPTTYTRYQEGGGHQYKASSLSSRNLRFKLKAHTDSHWPCYLLEWGKEKGLQDAGQWVRGSQASKGAAGRGKGLRGSRASVSLELLSKDDLITRWSHYPVGRISHVWQGIPLLSRHTLFCFFIYVVSPALPW